ncbi:MAG: YeeE/YedE thiosulfate transporter family protein [Chloroflexota bacterium]
MTTIVVPILIGLAFGWSLHKAGLGKYHKIVNVFRFTDLAVLKYMMSAMVVGVSLIYLFKGLGWLTLAISTPVYALGNFAGGLVFGVGMAAAGF